MKIPAHAQASYDAMKAAEATFRAERTPEAKAAYDAANAAYNAANPPPGSSRSRDLSPAARSGRRQHAEQQARTAASMARRWR